MKPTDTPTTRRVNRLIAQLNHLSVIDALEHAVEMRQALRIIDTWSSVIGALDPRCVREVTAKALHVGEKEA